VRFLGQRLLKPITQAVIQFFKRKKGKLKKVNENVYVISLSPEQ
jgi:hypothetical protein